MRGEEKGRGGEERRNRTHVPFRSRGENLPSSRSDSSDGLERLFGRLVGWRKSEVEDDGRGI